MRTATIQAKLRTELLRREKQRRVYAAPLIADLRAFLRACWPALEGNVRLEWDFHLDAMCMHAQLMVEEWYLAGLEPQDIAPTLDAWTLEGRPYVAGERAHWEATGRGAYQQRTMDLVVNVPPGSLKSRIWCVVWLAWIWTWCPSFIGFFTTSAPGNISRDSIACRDLVSSAWYRDTFRPPWQIRDDQNRVEEWSTTAGGCRKGGGTSANVVGVHADGIVFDDPDDSAKVWSDAERRHTLFFWRALSNRIKDPRRPLRVVMQQNLHAEDLSSRMVGDGVARLAIPLDFVEANRAKLYTAPFGWRDPRSDTERLQPYRYTEVYLAAQRLTLGSQGFAAQYECDPAPAGGAMFQRGWWRFFRPLVTGDALPPRARPDGCVGSGGEAGGLEQHPAVVLDLANLEWLELSVDASFGSVKDTASEVALQVIGGYGANRFVFDDDTKVRSWPETIAAVREKIRAWGPGRVLIERKANGAAVIDSLVAAMGDGSLVGPDGNAISVVIEPIDPTEAKESRWAAMSPEVEAGCWYLLDGAAWLRDYVDQFAALPQSRRNDRADASAQCAAEHRADMDAETRWRALAGMRS